MSKGSCVVLFRAVLLRRSPYEGHQHDILRIGVMWGASATFRCGIGLTGLEGYKEVSMCMLVPCEPL
jgi:hypothetical protein